jgi:hypothetical protein
VGKKDKEKSYMNYLRRYEQEPLCNLPFFYDRLDAAKERVCGKQNKDNDGCPQPPRNAGRLCVHPVEKGHGMDRLKLLVRGHDHRARKEQDDEQTEKPDGRPQGKKKSQQLFPDYHSISLPLF